MFKFSTRRIVEPSNPPKSIAPITFESLRKEIHELIDMLPDDMLEEASEGVLSVPDFPEDFDPADIKRFEKAKRDFRSGNLTETSDGCPKDDSIGESGAKYDNHPHSIRDSLHSLAEFMSGEILDEAVDVLKSTALLDMPYEMTPEEWADFLEGEEEIVRGDYVSWEEIKRTGVKDQVLQTGETLPSTS